MWSLYPERSLNYEWDTNGLLVDGLVEHVAFVFDLTAAYGSKVRLYVNGQDMGMAELFNEINPENNHVFPYYVSIGQRVSNGWILRNYVDNLKIWNYPKTDFSDRFTE